jgi:hypothetical protein
VDKKLSQYVTTTLEAFAARHKPDKSNHQLYGCRRVITTNGPFHKALGSQSPMLRGYRSQEWQQAYKKTYPIPEAETHKQRNKRQLQTTRWQKKIIQSTWGLMIALWTTRNDERHGRDEESQDSARREVLHKEVEDLYNHKHEYPIRAVQRLLPDSYEAHIQDMVTKIANWLEAYKGTFVVTWSPDDRSTSRGRAFISAAMVGRAIQSE